MKGRDCVLLVALIFIGWITWSCDDPLKDLEQREIQAYEDSVAQANSDQELIAEYLEKIGRTSLVTEEGLHYLVLDSGDVSRRPMTNDIITVDYIGKFLSDTIFDTTIEQLALAQDSSIYAANGIDIETMKVDLELDLAGVLLDLAGSDSVITNRIYFSNRSFEPLNFNYTEDGGLSGVIAGFRDGLQLTIPLLGVGGHSLVLIPSYQAYGAAGSGSIDPFTVLVFEFHLRNIRP